MTGLLQVDHALPDLSGGSFPERVEGPYAQLLEDAQALVRSNRFDYGKATVSTKEYQDVTINRNYRYAQLTVPQSDGQLVFEIHPDQIKAYRIVSTGAVTAARRNQGPQSLELTPELLKQLEKIVEVVGPYARQRLEVERLGFVALSKLTHVPVEQVVALGCPEVARGAERLVNLIQKRKVPDALRLYRNTVRPEVTALRDRMELAFPTDGSHMDLKNSISQLDATQAGLESNPQRRQFIERFIRATDVLMAALARIGEATKTGRTQIVPALAG